MTQICCTYIICTMLVKGKIVEFEWDKWNIRKSYFKQGVTTKECEEVFLDKRVLVIPDARHSIVESRFLAIGKTLEKKVLFIAFCIRNKKIRAISGRRMHKKEVLKYHEKIEESKKV